jgi:glycosyltransferase involved in cell wall biosynthesis
MSLDAWARAGILDRELALYRELSADVQHLAFVTYGGLSESVWTSLLPDVEVLPNRWGLAPNLYGLIAPWLHRESLRGASVFRTNQINGAWCGVIAKLLFGKTLVVRCGYLWADFVEKTTTSWWRRVATRMIERMVARSADRIIVAAESHASVLVSRYGVDPGCVTVIPNHVDIRRFRPVSGTVPETGQITFVGRLHPQKNLESLFVAIRGLPGVRLTVVGDGPLRASLESMARTDSLNVQFVGQLSHGELPALLNRSEVFVLPSHYEGHPKALLEAMACGVPVIGTRVPGIQEVLVHRETGFVCGTTPADIRTALLELLNDAALRARLRDGGVRYVREHCSLAIAVGRERALLASLPAA